MQSPVYRAGKISIETGPTLLSDRTHHTSVAADHAAASSSTHLHNQSHPGYLVIPLKTTHAFLSPPFQLHMTLSINLRPRQGLSGVPWSAGSEHETLFVLSHSKHVSVRSCHAWHQYQWSSRSGTGAISKPRPAQLRLTCVLFPSHQRTSPLRARWIRNLLPLATPSSVNLPS